MATSSDSNAGDGAVPPQPGVLFAHVVIGERRRGVTRLIHRHTFSPEPLATTRRHSSAEPRETPARGTPYFFNSLL